MNESITVSIVDNVEHLEVTLNEGSSAIYTGVSPAETQALRDRLDVLEAPRTYEAGASVLSHQPLAHIDGKVYPLDASNIAHAHAYCGFSETSANTGELLTIATESITLEGWALTPGQVYLAGIAGAKVTALTTELFALRLGIAVSADELKLTPQSPPIIRS